MELLSDVEQMASSFEEGKPKVNVTSLIELVMLLDLFERWHLDPAVPRIVAELETPASYAHAVVVLGAATLLNDTGNGVALGVADSQQGRSPDLWVATGPAPDDRVGVEVKAPLALQRRGTPVSRGEARKVIGRAIHKAGTGPGGQLASDRSGILLVGGFHLSRRDVDVLEDAAKREVLRRPAERKHIMAIAILSVGVLLGNVQKSGSRVMTTDSTQLQPIVTLRLAENPSYAGTLKISGELAGPLRPLDESSLREIDLS